MRLSERRTGVFDWWHAADQRARRAFVAAAFGWMLDAFDVMLYSMVVAALIEDPQLHLTLPGASSIPAVDSNHPRMAVQCGRRIVDMVWEDLKPTDVLTEAAFENAITVDMAIGGSTNAIIHLIAMAGRAGIKLDLKKFDQISQRTPMIANIRPSGEYLMEDFYYAGGLRALLKEIGELMAAGWHIGTHANGDVAIDIVLRVYERLQREMPRRDPRFRIEHCTLINDDLV